MKTRLNYYEPFGIGFNTIFNQLEQLMESSNIAYPPYNILKDGDDKYKIELAVAGFKKEDITIEIKDSRLSISSEKVKVAEEIEYVHHGISSKSFTRSFTLADHVEVESAKQEDGILTISLVRNIPESKLPKRVLIE